MCMQKFSSMLVNRTRYAAWDFIASCKMTTSVHLTPPSTETDTFSFHCQAQMVKVDSKIYHLDRFRSSLKSKYFEKLFTAENFDQKKNEVLEIQPKNSEVFSNVVELIYGKKLSEVLNKNNYIPLLEAMDHLGMEINLETVSEFIDKDLKSHSLEDAKIFQLYEFIRENSKFEYLLNSVFKSLHNHLTELQNHEIFVSFPRNHLIQLVKSIPKPDDEKRYQIIQLCTKWFCHDLENRLPEVVILVNSIKPEFHGGIYGNNMNNGVNKRLPKINVDEQAKMQIFRSFFFALLAHGGKLNPHILSVENSFGQWFDVYETGYDEVMSNYKWQFEEYEPGYSSSYINTSSEFTKLNEFLENGTLYDITIRVGEKTYEIHRTILESKSGYFKDIFRTEYAQAMDQCDGIPTYPIKEKEYVLNDPVDPAMFKTVIDYMYFGKNCISCLNLNPRWSWSLVNFDDVARVFKTADVLKIDGELTKNCEDALMKYHEKVSLQEVIGLVNYTHGKIKYDDLHSLFLTKYLREKWPEIDMSQFCSTSWSVLENVLESSDFYFNDPYEILDICSKWICHDAENRFCLLPKIARVLNPNCIMDDDKFKNEAADLRNYSLKLVRDKLLEILSLTPYTLAPEDLSNEAPKKLEEIPVFIAPNPNRKAIDVLNVNLDEITTLHCPEFDIPSTIHYYRCPVSAAMIRDNLFVICDCDTYRKNYFEVYNITSKKHFSLALDVRLFRSKSENMLKLLNCNNEIYCCSEEGLIMKYSTQMNRWIMISKEDGPNREHLRFTSDGETLFRIYQVLKRNYFVAEAYDFVENKWNPVPDLPLIKGIFTLELRLTVVNDHDLAVSSFPLILLSNRNSNKWIKVDIPHQISSTDISVFTQCEDRMLLVVRNELYQLDPSEPYPKWEFKKKLPLKRNCSETKFENLYYQSMAAIHRPRLC